MGRGGHRQATGGGMLAGIMVVAAAPIAGAAAGYGVFKLYKYLAS